ncbi:cobalt-precorrin 5A hydrolase [Hominifimenecus sp. rT4P-3]|uniref:cobalt-precorrin 5A hydrolase n=1 Tax=Hominifimenecus sp. rT4P-3 TaxID=3242979 RepID=UPI003DA430C7
MQCAVISFTLSGGQLAERLIAGLREEGQVVQGWCLKKWSEAFPDFLPIETSLSAWCEARWKEGGGLIFIGACGIAVRTIAPFIRTKTEDPAVIAADEKGNFVISLLSGHLGGGNALARQAADVLGGQAVITTATDVQGKFAVDVWAKENGLILPSMAYAKEISAAVLAGETIGFSCPYPLEGVVPEELSGGTAARLQITVGVQKADQPVFLSRSLVIGLGCRKGKRKEEIAEAVEQALREVQLAKEAVRGAATIDLKKEEEGLIAYCREQGWPLTFYTAEELSAVKGDFTPSPFVKKITGVDNVCERAAVLASKGRILVKKQAANGVTLAIAEENRRIHFG